MRDQRGFTLVELLVALALTGLVALLLLEGTRMAAQGTNRAAAQADRLEAHRTLEDLLRRELSAAVASPLLPNVAPLVGGPQKLEFLSLAEDGGAGLYRIRLEIENGGLVMSRSPVAGGAPDRTVLAPRIASLALAYFGTAPETGASKWRERWEGMRALPSLVRVTFDLGDGIVHPPLVVRLWAGS
jgi:general secretion pathway protein J